MKLISLLPIILLLVVLATCVGCMGGTETFLNSAPLDGSYKMSEQDGQELNGAEENHELIETHGFLPAAGVMDPNYPVVEDEAGKLFMFSKNKCDPSCCTNSNHSCNNGCVCKTNAQKQFLRSRGGNRVNVGNNF
jgi:hypothetical protein